MHAEMLLVTCMRVTDLLGITNLALHNVFKNFVKMLSFPTGGGTLLSCKRYVLHQHTSRALRRPQKHRGNPGIMDVSAIEHTGSHFQSSASKLLLFCSNSDRGFYTCISLGLVRITEML